VRTNEARATLRAFFRGKNRGEVIEAVKGRLGEASQRYYLSAEQLFDTALFEQYLRSRGYEVDLAEFLFDVAIGRLGIKEIMVKLVKKYREELAEVQKKLARLKELAELGVLTEEKQKEFTLLKKANLEPQPVYYRIEATDRIGLFAELANAFKTIGFSISEFFPLSEASEAQPGKIIIVLGIDVIGGGKGGGVVGQVQRKQVMNILGGFGKGAVIEPSYVRKYLEAKLQEV
jgi:hypothetical protein